MPTQYGETINIEIARVLGIPLLNTTKFTVVVEAGKIPIVTTESFISSSEPYQTVTQSFKLVPLND